MFQSNNNSQVQINNIAFINYKSMSTIQTHDSWIQFTNFKDWNVMNDNC